MGFQVYNSQGQELQNLTGSAGGDLTGTYPNPTLAKGPTYVTSLPSSPIDGQEIYYAADATNGVVWHLRYRSASSSSYKWEFVGGTELHTTDMTAVSASLTGSTWSNISTAITITVPLAGDYRVAYATETQRVDVSQGTHVGVKVDTTEPTVDTNTTFINTAAGGWGNHAQPGLVVTGVGANKVLTLRYRAAVTSTIYRYATVMTATPVRVG